MRSRSLGVLSGAALALLVVTGCASRPSASLSQRRWVNVSPANLSDHLPELHRRPLQLGACDTYGKMVYDRYLALRDRGDEPEGVRMVDAPAADATE